MKIKLSCGITGDRFVHNPGDEIEWNDVEARRFIEAGIASEVKSETPSPQRQETGGGNRRN